MTTLANQRTRLAYAVRDTDGAFPGSKGYYAHNTALDALAAFDEEHPEVRAEIVAKAKKEKEARTAGSFIARGLD